MQEQHYKNHSRYIPLYHLGVYGLVALIVGGSIIKLYKTHVTGLFGLMTPVLLILIGITLLLLTWYCRLFALKAQDRAIRAEERLRYFVMTGKMPDSRLRMRQIIALRFASDAEFVELTNRAVNEQMRASDIKKAIQNWKADYDRV